MMAHIELAHKHIHLALMARIIEEEAGGAIQDIELAIRNIAQAL